MTDNAVHLTFLYLSSHRVRMSHARSRVLSLAWLGICVFTVFSFCMGAHAQAGEWVWLGGNSKAPGNNGPQPGVYGTQGQFAAANIPGARHQALMWTDQKGKFWLYGGQGYDSASTEGYLDDLWEFDPALQQWAWIGGHNAVKCCSGTAGYAPVYGTQGQESASNSPGSRVFSVTWIDASGNLWLYGGQNTQPNGAGFNPDDMWEFDLSSKQWVWVGPSTVAPQSAAVYGTQGAFAAGNTPGSRYQAVGWVDKSGNVWIFGGTALYQASGISGPVAGAFNPDYCNEFWEFDVTKDQWAWLGGGAGQSYPGSYGTIGVPSAANWPPQRFSAAAWTDASGKAWVFGGYGGWGTLNDLWEYDPSTSLWTWVSGSNTHTSKDGTGVTGIYGTQGTAAAGNAPGSRQSPSAWTDSSGNLWLFGGEGQDSAGSLGALNDLWMFNPSTTQWTWVSGNDSLGGCYGNNCGQPGVYGTQGMPAAANTPGGRQEQAAWQDSNGNLWVFGGLGMDSAVTDPWNPLNDVWAFIPSGNALPAPPSFKLASSASSLTVPSGQQGSLTFSVTAQNGFNSTVNFACSALPAGASCSFSPTTVTPPGTTTTTLTITAQSLAANERKGSLPIGPGVALALGGFLFIFKRRPFAKILTVALTIGCLGMLSACGGGSSSTRTNPVTSTITVTASSGSLQQAMTISLTVQ